MADLNLKSFDKLYPMIIHKYESLIPSNDATIMDKLNSIIDYLNKVGKLTNDVVKDWNVVYQWVMNDGLTADVNAKLETMISNGEFSTILGSLFLGDLSTLLTTDKSNLVHAINENTGKITANTSSLADISTNIKSYTNLVVNGDWTNAFNTALLNHPNVFVPAGTYPCSGTININSYNKLIGVGRGESIIQSTNSTSAVLLVAGKYIELKDLTITRTGSIPTNTSAVGIKLGTSTNFVGQSKFSQLEVYNHYSDFYVDTASNVYSCTFEDFWLYSFANWGMDMQPYGATGIVLNNIYINNWNNFSQRTKYSAQGGAIFKNYSEIDLRQINVEHGIYNYGVYFNTCDTVNIRTLHIEGYEQNGDYKAVVMSDTSQVTIDEISVVYSAPTFDRTTFNPVGVTMWNVFGVAHGGKIYCDTLMNRNNYTVQSATGNYTVNNTGMTNNIAYNADGSQTYLTNTKFKLTKHKYGTDNKFTGFSSFTNINQRTHQIEEYNGQKYYLMQSDGTIMNYFLKATPTAGYWKTGDRIFNVSTAPATNADSICTQGGYLSPPASGVTTTVGTAFVSDIVVSSAGSFVIGDWITIVGSSRTFQITNIYTTGGTTHFVLNQNIEVTVTNATVQYAVPVFKGMNMIAS